MITIDGSMGEGGGQVLRTALSLSAVTGKSFNMHSIRAGRRQIGLMRQHLTCVLAAKDASWGSADGAELRSTSLTFVPGSPKGGDYTVNIGTAGSTSLVLQTLLPILLRADKPSTVTLTGGTHNPMAPPFEAIQSSFAPILERMGARLDVDIIQPGFYPTGGGEVRARVTPGNLEPIEILDRGAVLDVEGTALVSKLSMGIATRELSVLERKLRKPPIATQPHEIFNSPGPGNAVLITVTCEHHTEVFSCIGEKHRSAEAVATDAAREAANYMKSEAAVGEHLADQLLIPMALSGGGAFRTVRPSLHTRTNAEVIAMFLPVEFEMGPLTDGVVEIRCLGRDA